jgi:hypoxanthine phosphoribosyltransferase
MNKRFLEWRDIDKAVERLAINITNSNIKISYIKGLQRGGLIPAVLLSHKLNIPMISNGILDNSVLIVDDICDSGKTLEEYAKYKCYTATIHYKNSAVVEPNFWYKLASEEEWIVYPWEQKDSKTIQDYLNATERK